MVLKSNEGDESLVILNTAMTKENLFAIAREPWRLEDTTKLNARLIIKLKDEERVLQEVSDEPLSLAVLDKCDYIQFDIIL